MEVHLIQDIIKRSLIEDLAWGDVTSDTLIDPDLVSTLVLTLKEDGVVAGIPVAEQVFKTLDPELVWSPLHQDGEYLPKGTALVKLKGKSRQIVKAERVALNFMQRMSGIATLTHQYVQKARITSDKVRIADTRKTTPGLRHLEKYAVQMGGGHNHRFSLADCVFIKDNHVAMLRQDSKSIQEAIRIAREKVSHTVRIEVEVDKLDQVQAALEGGADIILLDNMTVEEMKQAVSIIEGRATIEASGGVTLENVAEVAASGVDVISVGRLTHSARALDISLDYL